MSRNVMTIRLDATIRVVQRNDQGIRVGELAAVLGISKPRTLRLMADANYPVSKTMNGKVVRYEPLTATNMRPVLARWALTHQGAKVLGRMFADSIRGGDGAVTAAPDDSDVIASSDGDGNGT